MLEAVRIKNKIESYEKIAEVKEEIINYMLEKYPGDDKVSSDTKELVNNLEASVVRDLIISKKERADGRKPNEIRDLSSFIDILPRAHGRQYLLEDKLYYQNNPSAIGEHQILDGLGIEDSKRFMHHYTSSVFVGETGVGAPGRREIGHGALGEKALLQVIPSEEEFPYTIRVVSEVLESNGSSHKQVCAGCLSLMAAGVPIKAPVAGIAMGLITKGRKHVVLTDIAGLEDHIGDMDFKVAGTRNGITALQMDIKIKGVTKSILKEALSEAKKARIKILDVMESVIKEPRKELSPYAPKIKMIQIDPEKIKDVIGRGGEMITKIILEASNVLSVNDKDAVKVDLEDDGRVIVYHTDYEIIDKTIKMIEDIIREVEEGEIYTGTVVKVEDFGCFVKLWEGTEGLVHVSQLAHERVNKPSDIVKVSMK